METIAEIFKHNFKDGDFKLFDDFGNEIYRENSNGYWNKNFYNDDYKIIKIESSGGIKIIINSLKTKAQKANHDFGNVDFEVFDEMGNRINIENLDSQWSRYFFDDNGILESLLNSNGYTTNFT